MKKFASTVAGASLIIIFFGLISKGLGFVREIVFAGSFGLSKDFDIYLAGSVLPLVINTGVIYLGQNFFIPSYNKLKSSNGNSELFFNSFLWIFASGGILLTVLLFIFSNNIINLYLINSSYQIRSVALVIFRIFLITVPVNAAISIIIAFLQAEFEFKAPAVSQLWVNFSVIILTLIFSARLNVYIIPVGFVVGMIVQLLYLTPKVKKFTKYRVPKFSGINKLISVTFSALVITVFIEIISQFYLIADRFFIKAVNTGGIAALNYAQILYMLPVSVFSIALSTAIFPGLAQKYHSDNLTDLNKDIITGLNINVFISLPLSVLFIFFGSYIISLFYQNGNFSFKDTITTFDVLRIFSLSLVFYSLYSILNKLIYGIGALKFLFVITVLGISIKFFLNFVLVGYYKQDGLALSTTLTYVYFFLISIVYVKLKLKDLPIRKFLSDAAVSLVNCLSAFIFIKILWDSLGKINLAVAVFLMIIFIAVYSANAIMLNQTPVVILKTAYLNFTGGSSK